MGKKKHHLRGAMALVALPTSMVVAAFNSKNAPVTPVDTASKSAEVSTASLSTMPMQNTAIDWAMSLHVPEFVGTLGAAAMLAWAVQSRRVI